MNEVIKPLKKKEIIEYIPHGHGFKFVDEIIEIDINEFIQNDKKYKGQILGKYTYRKDLDFYKYHFPDFHITPGVILIETMAQIGIVAHGLYLLSTITPREKIKRIKTVFSKIKECSFNKPVFPETTVFVKGKILSFNGKRKVIKSETIMYDKHNEFLARAILIGIGVNFENKE